MTVKVLPDRVSSSFGNLARTVFRHHDMIHRSKSQVMLNSKKLLMLDPRLITVLRWHVEKLSRIFKLLIINCHFSSVRPSTGLFFLVLYNTSSTMPNSIEIESVSRFQALQSEDLNCVSLINFWAKWAPSYEQTNDVVKRIANYIPQLLVLQVRFTWRTFLYIRF